MHDAMRPAKPGPQGGYKIALSQSSFRSGHEATIRSLFSKPSGVASVQSDLQTKLEKYERKAAQYGMAAQQATSGPDRAFYQGLASYCDDLAAKFRQVIAKRTETSQAAE